MPVAIERSPEVRHISTTGNCIYMYMSRSLTSPITSEDFVTKGLFSVVRHPNYLGEIIFWFGSYMAGVGRWVFGLIYSVAFRI